jgi:type I restriction enzyme S subunit
MQSNYKRLGDYIQEVNIRNRDLNDYPLLGVSVKKVFMPSIANTVGTDFGTYKIVKRNQFTYIPDTSRRGEKIGLAFLDSYDYGLVSQAYTVFKIIDENELHPEYLMMWFKRPEFDRYARVKSHGSVREIFDWQEMCDVLLPIPSPEKQLEIVREYNVIQNRIKLNNQLIAKLEETAQTIYKQWFVDFEFPNENGLPYKSNGGEMVESELGEIPKEWEVGKLNDVSIYVSSKVAVKRLKKQNYISTENMLQNRGGIVEITNLPKGGNVTGFEIDDILISNIRPYFKKIWKATYNGGCSNDILCFRSIKSIGAQFLYYTLETDLFFDYVMAGSNGAKMPRGDKTWIMKYKIIIPNEREFEQFGILTSKLKSIVVKKFEENMLLSSFQNLLYAKMSTVELEKEFA